MGKDIRDAEEIAEERVNGTGIRLTNGLKRALTYGAIAGAIGLAGGLLMMTSGIGLAALGLGWLSGYTATGVIGGLAAIAAGVGFLGGVSDDSPVEKAVEREAAMINRKNMRSQMQQRQAAAEEMAVAQQYAAMQRQGQMMGLNGMNNNAIQPQVLPPAPGGGMMRG